MRKNFFLFFLVLVFSPFFEVSVLLAQNNGPGSGRRNGRVNGRRVRIQTRNIVDTSQCARMEFRTIDGTCNNLRSAESMEFGARDIVLRRSLPPAYGLTDPFNAMGGDNRFSARAISNIVSAQIGQEPSNQNLSAFVFSWGQFLDHDISLTPEAHNEFEPISLPANEPLFTQEIPFFRSEIFANTGQVEAREQLNLITAWIDASMVYGSEPLRADWLRTHQNGKLKVSSGNLLPFNTLDGEYGSPIDTAAPSMAGADANGRMWVAGDIRAGEQTGLTCLHTLFVREHNRLCDELIGQGLQDDEEIYQKAREQIIAQIQKISYDEFLPAMGVSLDRYEGYDSRVRPDISNEFATGAYRLGHTMVTGGVRLVDANCQPMPDSLVSLIEAFFNPSIIQNNGIDPYLKGLSLEVQSEVDLLIVDELRNFLFSDPNSSPIVAGFDLAALNIQRGRDHGLADYNSARQRFRGRTARDFSDISRDSLTAARLSAAYQGDINNIDLWVGLLAEDKVNGTSLGPTLLAMLKDQFERLRDGDRFYFENSLGRNALSNIDNTSLSDIIQRNTQLSDLPSNIMFASTCNGNVQNNNRLASQLDIFPNPSEGEIRIKRSRKDIRIEAFSVIDLRGMTLINQRAYERRIDLSFLQPGTYFIQIFTNKGMATKSLVME